MPYKFNFRQKSPTRRFLLILGLATFVACFTLGLMIIFWDRVNEHLNLSKTQRILFGSLFLIYGLLRFSRLFKEEPEDEE
jgi:threonine/homoserine/homoserine lactone efflux protein